MQNKLKTHSYGADIYFVLGYFRLLDGVGFALGIKMQYK